MKKVSVMGQCILKSILGSNDPSIEQYQVFLKGKDADDLLNRTINSGGVFSAEAIYEPQSTQFFIYHHCLTTQQKKDIYESSYEIGNPEKIVNESEQELHDYLYQEYGGEDCVDLIKRIKREIHNLTGIPFKEFVENDKSLAFKVLALFYRIARCHRSQIFSFLNYSNETKTNFEFRSVGPLRLSQHNGADKALENTALLIELKDQLTFQMPRDYIKSAQRIIGNLYDVGQQVSIYIKSEIDGFNNKIPNYSPSNVERLLAELPSSQGYMIDRLDYLLYKAICLREYEVRIDSREIMLDVVYGTPITMQSLRNAAVKSFSEQDVIDHLLGEKTQIRPTLEIQASFIKEHINLVSLLTKHKPAPDFEIKKHIIKALILHDEKLNIKIPITIQGINNIPTSPTAMLKDVVRFYTENNKYPEVNNYSEALSEYWEKRYHFCIDTVLASSAERVKCTYMKIGHFEIKLDRALLDYLKKSDVHIANTIMNVPKKVRELLGYIENKNTYIVSTV